MSQVFTDLDALNKLVSDAVMGLATRIGALQDKLAALEAGIGENMTSAEVAKLKLDINQILTDVASLAPTSVPTARRP